MKRSEQTLRLFDTKKQHRAFFQGYSDGATGAESNELRFHGDAFVAYICGYAQGADATFQILGKVG